MKSHLEILIDNSNSMGDFKEKDGKSYLLPDGTTRMQAAKKILLENIWPLAQKYDSVRTVLFCSKPSGLITEQRSFAQSNMLALENYIKCIKDPENTGGTPITKALSYSYASFETHSKYQNSNRQIILITDGQETDGGDYEKLIGDRRKDGKDICKVFIVGIAQKIIAQQKAKRIAELTGGGYIHLEDQAYDSQVVQEKLAPLITSVTVDNIKNTIVQNKPQSIDASVGKIEAALQPKPMHEPDSLPERQKLDTLTIIESIVSQMESLNNRLAKMEDSGSSISNLKFGNERPEENQMVGKESEKIVFDDLKKIYSNVVWENEKEESGKPYDFVISIDNVNKLYVECKGTMSNDNVFLLTKNEWMHLLKNKTTSLYFVSDVFRNPKIIRIHNLWEAISTGVVLPIVDTDVYLKKDRIVFTIM